MKVARVESFTQGTNLCLVRVTADDGSQGIGQAAPFNADITAQVLHRQVARYALGRDPLDTAGLAERVIEGEYKYPGSYVCRALAGVDTALWDLRGRLEGRSVCELLGGRPRPFPAYASSMRRDIQPQAEAERLVRLRDRHGFRAVKVRIGKVCGRDQDQWPGRTEALVPAVRSALGSDVRLLVDGNSGYTPAKAIAVGRLLEDHGVCHFEEPCPYWELEWTAQVAAALRLDVAGGEQDCSLTEWRRMLALRAVDVAQPDVCYVGGLTRALEVARLAAAAGLPVVPHSANLSLVSVFSLHLLGAIPNAGPYMEYGIEPTPWTAGLYAPELVVTDGCVPIPDGPGWGVTVRPEWLAGAVRQVSES